MLDIDPDPLLAVVHSEQRRSSGLPSRGSHATESRTHTFIKHASEFRCVHAALSARDCTHSPGLSALRGLQRAAYGHRRADDQLYLCHCKTLSSAV